MGRESLRTRAGWRLYDQANLVILALLGLLFWLASQSGSMRAAAPGPQGRDTPTVPQARVPAAAAPASGPAIEAPTVAGEPASAPSADAVVAAAPAASPPVQAIASPATPAPATTAPATGSTPAPGPAAEQCAVMARGFGGGFVPGKPALSLEGRQKLDLLVPCLAAGSYVVGVHTDSGGDAAANDALTQARAEAVVKHLVSRGVPGDRLQARGMGAREPAASNDTEEGRKANRRTTITPG